MGKSGFFGEPDRLSIFHGMDTGSEAGMTETHVIAALSRNPSKTLPDGTRKARRAFRCNSALTVEWMPRSDVSDRVRHDGTKSSLWEDGRKCRMTVVDVSVDVAVYSDRTRLPRSSSPRPSKTLPAGRKSLTKLQTGRVSVTAPNRGKSRKPRSFPSGLLP